MLYNARHETTSISSDREGCTHHAGGLSGDRRRRLSYALQAVRLYGLGYTPAQIAEICGAPRSTLLLWCALYREGGIAALDDHRSGGNSAKLSRDQVADLSRKLRLYTPRSLFGPEAATSDGQAWTVTDLRRAVQEWYGVTYQSLTSYYSLFDRCEYSYHQPTKVFKSRNEAAVMQFETLLEKN